MKRSNLKRKTPLKRTSMQPAKSQLKRSSKLNRRSKTNSRPNEDVPLRDLYGFENPNCELTPILIGCRVPSWEKMLAGWRIENEAHLYQMAGDRNHIFSVGSRPDVWSNLIRLAKPVHAWFHDNLVEGRIACLYRKVFDPRFDLAEIDAAAGQSVLAWLSRQTVCGFFDKLRVETIRAMGSVER